VVFSPDGQRLASGSGDRNDKDSEDQSVRDLLTLRGHTYQVSSVVFSPDGHFLASGSYDNTVKRWDAKSGQELLTLRGHTDGVTSVVFSPDGQRLATGSWDKTVKLWEAKGGPELLILRGHTAPVTNVAFSPDGQRLASASYDMTVKLWAVQSGQELLTLRGHTAEVNSVVFSPDGQRLASGSWDKTVKLWTIQSGQALLTLRGHAIFVTRLVFSADGQRLFSQDASGSIGAWDSKTGEALTVPAELPLFGGSAARHPTRAILAVPVADEIHVVDLRPPDDSELGYRLHMARFDPAWQDEQAAKYEKSKSWYAAIFHRGQLAGHEPTTLAHWDRLETASMKLGDYRPALGLCDRLLRADPSMAAIYFRRARLRAALFQFHDAAADQLSGLLLSAHSAANAKPRDPTNAPKK
jgi:dipeptidyl aminopeptidase/acylaminoacyl peptidase